MMSRMKPIWVWLCGGVAAVIGVTWGIMAWMKSSASPVTAVKTSMATGSVVVAVAFSFSFADKGNELVKHWREIASFVEKGQDDAALQYVADMSEALDGYIQNAEGRNVQQLQRAQLHRQIAGILDVNIRMAVNDITETEWANEVHAALLGNRGGAADALDWILTYASREIPLSRWIALLERDIPHRAGAVLVGWCLAEHAPGRDAMLDEIIAFYDQLLLAAKATPQQAEILQWYVSTLDDRKEYRRANEMLEMLIAIFSQDELGVLAAELRLAGAASHSERSELITEWARVYSGTPIIDRIFGHYVSVLVEMGDVEKAITEIHGREVSGEGRSATMSPEMMVQMAIRLIEVCEASTIQDRHGARQEARHHAPLTLLNVVEALARKRIESEEYVSASRLVLAALNHSERGPVHIVHGQSIRRVEELFDPSDESAGKHGWQFLYAALREAQGHPLEAEVQRLQLVRDVTSRQLRPYVALYEIDRQIAAREFQAAKRLLDETLAIVPDSPALKDRAGRIQRELDDTARRDVLVTKRESLLHAAKQNQNISSSMAQYREAAEINIALGIPLEAVDIYVAAAAHHAGRADSADLLMDAILILNQAKLQRVSNLPSGERQRVGEQFDRQLLGLAAQLLSEYPNYERTREVQQLIGK